MVKANDEGIPLEDYIKLHEQPEPLVRTKLNRGELRYTWVDADGNARASDDGGPQPSQGWWTATATTIDSERRSVKGSAFVRPTFRDMFFVRVYPPVTVTDAPAASDPPSVKDWLFAEVERRKEVGDVPTGRGAAIAFSEQLSDQMVRDAQSGKCHKTITAESIRARLYELGLWPPK